MVCVHTASRNVCTAKYCILQLKFGWKFHVSGWLYRGKFIAKNARIFNLFNTGDSYLCVHLIPPLSWFSRFLFSTPALGIVVVGITLSSLTSFAVTKDTLCSVLCCVVIWRIYKQCLCLVTVRHRPTFCHHCPCMSKDISSTDFIIIFEECMNKKFHVEASRINQHTNKKTKTSTMDRWHQQTTSCSKGSLRSSFDLRKFCQ